MRDPAPRAVTLRRPPPLTPADRRDLRLVEHARPPSLRAFDQIPMHGTDLLQQVKVIAPAFVGARVAFVGDSDGMSLLLGLLSVRGGPRPAALHLLDFDERLLDTALVLARQQGFSDLLHVWCYNVFDPVPSVLAGHCDWFYTNPPYGMRNNGASARLFIARGCELVTLRGSGGLVLPDDPARPWTGRALQATLTMLDQHGWTVRQQFHARHRYCLDDDPGLTSDLIVVDRIRGRSAPALPYAGRRVGFEEIPYFYGQSTPLPYPRYITIDSTFDEDWTFKEQAHEWQRPARGKVA